MTDIDTLKRAAELLREVESVEHMAELDHYAAALESLAERMGQEAAGSVIDADMIGTPIVRMSKSVPLGTKLYTTPQPTPEDVRDAQIKELTEQRDAAVYMLAEWCHAIDTKGIGWDYWNESYKDAAYRPGPLRELIDAQLAAMQQEQAK